MVDKIKYIYYFRGDLSFGVHFFEAWVKAVRNQDIPMKLITFLNNFKYIKQLKFVKYYKTRDIIIYPNIFGRTTIFIYFFLTCLINNKIIIHLKKRPSNLFDKLKYFFPKKLKYIVEGEGDPLSEKDYLIKHPYKNKFYFNVINSLDVAIKEQKNLVYKSDLLTVGTPYFKDILIKRYPDVDLKNKISVVQMSFSRGSLFFSNDKRIRYRKEFGFVDKFVLIYTGNAYYSWQNVYRTIQISKILKKIIKKPIYLVLLIKEKDHYIVQEFLRKLHYKDEFLLKQIPHNEIINYLNSSDLGVALRHKHAMNKIASSGKILEYLACGLPVLTTFHNGTKQPLLIEKNGYGAVLNNMDDDDEVIKKVLPYVEFDLEKRNKMSKWANEHLSTEAFIDDYISKLKLL